MKKSNKNIVSHLKEIHRLLMTFAVLLVIVSIACLFINIGAGMCVGIVTFIYIIGCLVLYKSQKKNILQQYIDFATNYGQVQKQMLKEHVIPYAVLDENCRMTWMNDAFKSVTKAESAYSKSITGIIPSVTRELLEKVEGSFDMLIKLEERSYRVEIRKFDFQEFASQEAGFDGFLYGIHLIDVTELHGYIKALDDTQMVAGLIYIDNYDETFETIETVKRSMVAALIDRKINQYLESADGIVKRIEKDKYYIVFKKKYLSKLCEDKFSLIEDVRAINLGNDSQATLSIGIGFNPDGYVATMEYSRMAIDLALGRGGDQVVVKEPNKISYFGGNVKTVEKTTRVKARVKAHALREIIESKDNVVIMGHKIADVDSFGAAVGIYKACEVLNKKAHIVLNEITSSVRPMVDTFLQKEEYPLDMFVTSAEAVEIVTAATAVVVVDVNKPSYCECSEILGMTKTLVVLDHHRQGEEVIENPVLYYVEPYASSACEMVAEILQYFAESIKIKNNEADCMYAGIMIDTNNFTSKAGVRTFEAAAYLRRCGADVTRVRKMFRNDIESYKAKADVISRAELYQGFAISVCKTENISSPTIVGAQAANELLNILGVKASIVITDYNGTMYLSARSIDEVNVSRMMERLGGGGHGGQAGAQLMGYTAEEAIQTVKKLIDDMLVEGDI